MSPSTSPATWWSQLLSLPTWAPSPRLSGTPAFLRCAVSQGRRRQLAGHLVPESLSDCCWHTSCTPIAKAAHMMLVPPIDRLISGADR